MNRPLQSSTIFQWYERRLVWHPLLFSMAPVLSLAGYNLLEIHPLAGLRSLLLLLPMTMFNLILLQRWIKDKQRAALVCSIFLLLFFSYGHVYFGLVSESAHGLFSRIGLIGNHFALGLTWLGLFLASLWISARARFRMGTITQLMNLMAIVTVIVPLIQIIRFEYNRSRPVPIEAIAPGTSSLSGSVEQPDIYYLVLDGYGRQDILHELYSFDNTEFLTYLEQQGFAVVRHARSNYVQTNLSVTAALNMEYLPDLLETTGSSNDARMTLSRLIRDNRVVDFLGSQGYRSVAFASGYRPTELRKADRFLISSRRSINPLEGLLLETSAFAACQALGKRLGFPSYYPGYESHRQLIQYTLAALPDTVELPGPKFVFAHIVIPHPPFVFDSTGQPVTPDNRFSFMDGDAFQGTNKAYFEGYRDQLAFLNDQLELVISGLLQRSTRPLIIVLQGDHGPGLELDYHSYADTNLDERTAILHAIRLPADVDVDIPDTLTPVNTFRFVLSQYYDPALPLLPDRSYYSTWSAPLEFIPVESSDRR